MSVEIDSTDDAAIELTAEEIALAEADFDGSPIPNSSDDDDSAETDDADADDSESTEGADDDGNVEGEPAGGKDSASEKNKADDSKPAFDQADIDRAKALGMEDEDLADFGSPKALRRYLDLEEKVAALASGKPADGDAATDAKSAAKPAESVDELLKLELYDGTDDEFKDEPFDERSLGIAKAVRREQELRIEAQKKLEGLEQFVSQLQHERIISQFSDAVDSLSNPALGEARDSRGRMVALSNEQVAARTRLFAEVEKIAADQQQKGKTGLTWDETVAEASKRLGIKASPKPAATKDKSEALRKQSAARRPISSGSASAKPARRSWDDEDDDDRSAEEIADDPAIVAFWKENARD